MQRRLNAQEKQLHSTKRVLEGKKADIMKKAHKCRHRELELKATHAAMSTSESVMRDFSSRLCTGYSSLLRTQESRYRDRPNAVLVDAQAHSEYLGGYRTRMGAGGRGLHVGEADGDEERGGSARPPQKYGCIVEVVQWPRLPYFFL